MAVGKTVTVGFDWGFGLPTSKKHVDSSRIDVLLLCSRKSCARHASSRSNNGKNIRKMKYEKSADA